MKNLKFVFLVSLILFIIFIQIRAKYYDKEFLTKCEFTIIKVDSFDVMPKFTRVYSSFYHREKKIINSVRKSESNISEKDIGKFYEVKYLIDTPEISRANFSKQITDTSAILKAGFKLEDIK